MLLNSPIILGASVLDLSKVIMYDLLYHKLSAINFNELNLLYTDTDSFLISVKNSFSEIEAIILENNQLFDLSNLSPSSNLYRKSTLIEFNRRKVGLLKLETADKQIGGFICLQPKCYSLLLTDGSEQRKAKGIPRAYIKNYLKYQQYLANISSGAGILAHFSKIVSNKHIVTTALISKKALSSLDTKRYFSYNPRTMSYAFGHHALNNIS